MTAPLLGLSLRNINPLKKGNVILLINLTVKPKDLKINTHLYTLIMKFMITKKDIIALNQEFENGKIHNEASLDFILSHTKKTENWTKALALLTRAILIDHVFEDGNKRTAALLIKTYAEYEGHKTYNDKITQLIKEIIIKNITSIKKIEEKIKNAIK
jgi:prophage maintenance system killer protein